MIKEENHNFYLVVQFLSEHNLQSITCCHWVITDYLVRKIIVYTIICHTKKITYTLFNDDDRFNKYNRVKCQPELLVCKKANFKLNKSYILEHDNLNVKPSGMVLLEFHIFRLQHLHNAKTTTVFMFFAANERKSHIVWEHVSTLL